MASHGEMAGLNDRFSSFQLCDLQANIVIAASY
ncbi:hypothetical protein EHW99_2025 [Erwinia amylovora]|uniref:Uncharacterized protein n=2 Tax=Erwinia amylovora TaxID=552 RepID=A0A831A0T4_ERWAM|nr:hypothetical protein EaACW_1565 [Erwinia amylovora ACW56400]QJQ54727.1 hypothetical protein EHX00_2025 [Erwinia amylovora]CBA20507.1 hypothetical protein predicted by Glimmer/Critica [Erwinia amylovora CFBP1430]CCO78410.1 hypothetical protein BN432_1607 [Erwinia amylovora Ea356]CCO82199.1 hypothetical protein BN433_1623 [Erwinia amylovora Ea266]CCO85994.1 hypothetical protein BN434_1601 [Erwinia amylovora CFBP 2585]CCO89784.1 hypothetical protein BN435_1607 [Erwinia amylovora 01SFR-BO]CCO